MSLKMHRESKRGHLREVEIDIQDGGSVMMTCGENSSDGVQLWAKDPYSGEEAPCFLLTKAEAWMLAKKLNQFFNTGDIISAEKRVKHQEDL